MALSRGKRRFGCHADSFTVVMIARHTGSVGRAGPAAAVVETGRAAGLHADSLAVVVVARHAGSAGLADPAAVVEAEGAARLHAGPGAVVVIRLDAGSGGLAGPVPAIVIAGSTAGLHAGPSAVVVEAEGAVRARRHAGPGPVVVEVRHAGPLRHASSAAVVIAEGATFLNARSCAVVVIRLGAGSSGLAGPVTAIVIAGSTARRQACPGAVVVQGARTPNIRSVAHIEGVLDLGGLQDAVAVQVEAGLHSHSAVGAIGAGRLGCGRDQRGQAVLPVASVLAICTVLAVAGVARLRDLVRLKYSVAVQVEPTLDADPAGWAVHARGLVVLPDQRVHTVRAGCAVCAVCARRASCARRSCRAGCACRPSRALWTRNPLRSLRPGAAIAHHRRGCHFRRVKFAVSVLIEAERDARSACRALAARTHSCHADNGVQAVQIGLDPGSCAAVANVELGIAPHVPDGTVGGGATGWQTRTGQGELRGAYACRRGRGRLDLARTGRRAGQQAHHYQHSMIPTATVDLRRREPHQLPPLLKVESGAVCSQPLPSELPHIQPAISCTGGVILMAVLTAMPGTL